MKKDDSFSGSKESSDFHIENKTHLQDNHHLRVSEGQELKMLKDHRRVLTRQSSFSFKTALQSKEQHTIVKEMFKLNQEVNNSGEKNSESVLASEAQLLGVTNLSIRKRAR